MAKKITIDIEVNGKMQKATVSTKKLKDALDGVDKSQKKVGDSAQTTDRRLKGAAQASANGTKNFSKMAQGISGGLVPAYATLAAQVFAVSAVFQFLKDASDISNLIAGQEALAQTTGVAYKSISNSLREATLGQLSYAEASRASAIGTAAGLNPTQLTGLANAAKNASVALGRDLTDSFNRLIRGVTKAEPELLDELGIILRLEPATQKYAAMIGKTANELDAFERSQAVAVEVLEQAEQKFGALESVLDPSTASLNRFIQSFDELINLIKVNVIQKLRPVFDFLSANTTGLSAALTLFALPIVKSILPSFSDWRKEAKITLDEQQKKLGSLSTSLKSTELDLKKLGKTQSQLRKEAVGQAAGAFSSAGIETPAPSKTSQSGADFLLGRSPKDSARAAANADKILKNAENQLKRHATVQTGTLKGANAKQVADMRASYVTRMGILTEYGVAEATMYQKADLAAQKYYTKGQIMMTKFRSFMTASSIMISRGLNAIFAATGIIGLISLIGSVGYEIYKALNPANEEAEKLKNEIQASTEKVSGLVEELSRVPLALESSRISLDQKIIAVGNAVNSADLPALLQNLESVRKRAGESSEGFKTYRTEVLKLMLGLSDLDPRFAEFGVALYDNDKLTKEQTRSLADLSKEFISAGQAAQNLPRIMQQIREEQQKLFGKAPDVSPFQDLLRFYKAAEEAAGLQATAGSSRLTALIAEASAAASEAERLEGLLPAGSKRVQTRRGVRTIGEDATSEQLAELKNAKDRATELADAVEKARDDVRAFNDEVANTSGLYYDLIQAVNEQEAALATISENEEKRLNLLNAGITFQGKINNLSAKELSNSNKILRQKMMYNVALASENLAKDENSGVDKDTLANLEEQTRLAKEKLTTVERELGIDNEKLALQKEITRLQKVIQPTKNEITLVNLKKQLAGLTQKQAGFAREVLKAEEEQAKLGIERSLRKERRENPFAFLDEDRRRAEAMYNLEVQLSEKKQEQVQKEYDLKVTSINLEYDLLKLQLKVQRNALLSQRKQLEGKDATLTLDEESLFTKIEAQIEPSRTGALASADASRSSAAAGIREAVEAAKEGKENLADINVLTDGIATSFESNMTSAFTSILDGTAKAKDAFANMAKSILQYIIQMTVKMLIFRAISGFFSARADADFLGVETTNFTTGEIGGFRTGGIMSEGRKMPGYSTGGIAKGSQAGYPAILHGTEAVVPLPNGRSIPVQMSGAGQENNVTVNVAVDNQGSSTTNTQSDSDGAERLGLAISEAVKKELLNQKRVGGMLSPYGVA